MRFEEVPLPLLRACQSGSARHFEELCGLLQADLYAFIFSILRDHDSTDEALQECLLRIYKHLPKLEDPSRFAWWLMRMAVNQCNSLRRPRPSDKEVPLDERMDVEERQLDGRVASPPSPRAALEQKQMRGEINAAIRELPDRQREAIVLFEVEGMAIKEIASVLECSEGAVKFNIHEARKKLRESLKQYLKPQSQRKEA